MADTPRVTVPVEQLKNWRNDLSLHGVGDIEAAVEMAAMLSAAPAPEGGAISRDQVFAIVRQFASPSWCSVDRLVDTLFAALATREEAPACEMCNGRGEVGGPTGQTPESFDYVTERCPDCGGAGNLEAPAEAVPSDLLEVMERALQDAAELERRGMSPNIRLNKKERIILKLMVDALRAQPPDRAWGWDYEICTGCSASLTIEDIKASGKVSCCPDRRMVTVRDLVDAYDAQRKPPAREDAQPVAWRPVVGFEDYYEVSSEGDIRRCDTGKLLAKNLAGKGYVKAEFWREGRRTQTYVHRVVARAFLEQVPGKEEVNHIDGDKTNNAARNLEWTDRKGNTDHSRYVLGNDVKPVLATDPKTGSQEYFPSIEEAGRSGYNASGIYDALNGRKKTHGGKTWSFTEWRGPQTIHPAPDALRVAVEALEPFARAADKLDGLWSEDDWRWNDSVRSGVTVRDIRRARQALAALQAEQKGGVA